MKFFAAFILMSFSLVSFAQGGGDRVGGADPVPPMLSIFHPANPMMRTPVVRTVEIFANKRVVETILTYRNGSPTPHSQFNLLTTLSSETMGQVNKCVGEFAQQALVINYDTGCMDDAGTYYRGIYNENNFAVSFCGQVQALAGKCAQDMVNLLNKLSRY